MAVIKKHKGSTLVEALVALSIVSLCSTLAVTIYLNIQQSAMSFVKIKSGELAAKYVNDAIQKKDFFDNNYEEGEFTIKKIITRNILFSDCMDIKISVYDNRQKKQAEREETVYIE